MTSSVSSRAPVVYVRTDLDPMRGTEWELIDLDEVEKPSSTTDPQRGAPLYERVEWIELKSILQEYQSLENRMRSLEVILTQLQQCRKALESLPVSGSEYIPYTEAWNKSALLQEALAKESHIQLIL